jgi:hypothetical protein
VNAKSFNGEAWFERSGHCSRRQFPERFAEHDDASDRVAPHKWCFCRADSGTISADRQRAKIFPEGFAYYARILTEI